jgi:hypothetical protein
MPAEIADVTDILVKIRNYINGFIESPESKQIEGWKLLFGDPFPSV